ncbi:MAG: GNAT family N-acetyltransferase [Propionibacteriaceae bacterium]|jgi:GNAT superfamily N-acetyltransferase|nr:GNAT family N-acetyltransferase [Propionibacteriaceae bacterium]
MSDDAVTSNGAASAIVEGTLEWHFCTEADVPHLAQLRSAIEYVDDPIDQLDEQCILDDFHALSPRPGFVSTVGFGPGGNARAYGALEPDEHGRLWMRLGVHPANRDKGIGRALVRWVIRRAREWHHISAPGEELWIGFMHEDRQGPARPILNEGFVADWWVFDAHRDLSVALRETFSPPPGVTIAPCTMERLSKDVRVVVNRVLEHIAGSGTVSEEQWASQLEQIREHLSWLAIDEETEAIIGFALNTVYNDETTGEPIEGWTLRLGVEPGARHLGIGAALVSASANGFFEAGIPQAGLGVDTDDPHLAEEFFARCGYIADDRVVRYVYRELPAQEA